MKSPLRCLISNHVQRASAGVDRFEVFWYLQDDPSCAVIPVAMLSADATKTLVDQFSSMTTVDYVTNPLELDRLCLDRPASAFQ
jgi:CheY-like chemotaxis protein